MTTLLPAGLVFKPGFSPEPQGENVEEPMSPARGGAPAPARETAATQEPGDAKGKGPPSQECGWTMMLPMVALFAFFYFFMIRPQQKQEKTRKAMLSTLQKTDKVLTTSGIYATVVSLDEKTVTLKIDEKGDVRVKFDRNAVSSILNREATS